MIEPGTLSKIPIKSKVLLVEQCRKPAPISDEEANSMLGQIESGFKKPKTEANFSEGETVKVIEGPFRIIRGNS